METRRLIQMQTKPKKKYKTGELKNDSYANQTLETNLPKRVALPMSWRSIVPLDGILVECTSRERGRRETKFQSKSELKER